MWSLPSPIPGWARIRVDADGVVRDLDPEFAALVGRPADEVLGQSYWSLTAPGQKQRVLNHLLSGGSFEQEILGADGRPVTILVAAGPVDDGWFAYVEPARRVGADDPKAVERALRHQNAVLLDLAKNEAIDRGELEPAMRAITEAGAAGLRCARSSVWLYADGETTIQCLDLYQFQERQHSGGFSLFAKDFPGYFAALAEDRTIAANDAHTHPATREFSEVYLTPLGITGMLEAPIRLNGRLLGVLCSEHIGPKRVFSQEEQNFAAAVADTVGRVLQAHERAKADQALRDVNANLERLVTERTAALQLTLDSMGDALLVSGPDGALHAERSMVTEAWFGPVPVGEPLWTYIARSDARLAASIALGFEDLREAVMPPELVVDQLPREWVFEGRDLRSQWKPVFSPGGELERVVLVLSDVTAQIAQERAEAAQRELPSIVSHAVRDAKVFTDFVAEVQRLLALVGSDAPFVERRRALHTIKGNASIYGFHQFAAVCHDLEDHMADAGVIDPARVEGLVSTWSRALEPIQPFLNASVSGISLTQQEYDALVATVSADPALAWLVSEIATWVWDRVDTLLEPLAAQAGRISAALGKEVAVEVHTDGRRVSHEVFGPFFASLVHPVRNAVDHGIEEPARREAAGKPRGGVVRLDARTEGDRIVVEIADDGAGINWERVAEKAAEKGLPHATERELVAALFADGLSTRDEVTSLSGRGVGLASTLALCEELGGTVQVWSTLGVGTTFRFEIPRGDPAASVSEAA